MPQGGARLGGKAPAARLRDPVAEFLADRTLEQVERRAIQEALRRTGHNLSAACRELGIGRTTLYRKLDKHGLR